MGKPLDPQRYAEILAGAPEGVSPDSINAALARKGYDLPPVQGVSRLRTPAGLMRGSGNQPTGAEARAYADRGGDYAQMLDPANGAMLLGLPASALGPAGTILGSAGGAAAFKALQNRATGKPAGEGVQTAAAVNGSLAGLGDFALGPIADAFVNPMLKTRIAQRVMANVLNPGDKLLGRSPNLVRNSLRDQIPLEEGMTMQGTEKVGNLLNEARDTGREMAIAHPSQAKADPLEILQQMRDYMNAGQEKNSVTRIQDNPEWQALEQDFLDRYRTPQEAPPVPQFPAPPKRVSKFDMRRPIGGVPQQRPFPMGERAAAETQMLEQQVRGAAQRAQAQPAQPSQFNPFDLEDMLTARQNADERIIRLHNAREGRNAGKNVAVTPSMQEDFDKAMAEVLRAKIRAVAPDLGEQMDKISDLMARKAAYGHAEARREALATANPLVAAIKIGTGPGPASRMAMRLFAAGERPLGPMTSMAPSALRVLPRLAPYAFQNQPQPDPFYENYIREVTNR